jgi:hypothetical protein
MKRLTIRGALCCALISPPVLAELAPLDEPEMSMVSGQAGLSIELETQLSIGEIAYKDQGFLLVRDFSLGGIGGTSLDNMLITMDVAGDGEVLNYGFSRMAAHANAGLVNAGNTDVAAALTTYNQGGQYGKVFNDGDLVIHIDSINSGVTGGNGSDQNIAAYTSAIDFQLDIASVELEKSGYGVGSATSAGQKMFSDISLQGYLGPIDIVIRNAYGTQTPISPNMSASDSRMEIEAHFEVTDLDLNWDNADILLIFNFAALRLEDVKVHNRRGADTAGHFGMASVKATLGEATSTATGVTGLGIYDIDIRADVDMPHFQFGTAPSIGGVFLTDFAVTADVLVYGH